MEPEQTPLEKPTSKIENLHKVTPLSKYLAMALFIALPFIGGWIGYKFTPEKVLEIERITEIHTEETTIKEVINDNGATDKIANTMDQEIIQPTLTNHVDTKYLLTIKKDTFQIITSDKILNQTVIYESNVPIFFGESSFTKYGSLITEGVGVNGKLYTNLQIQPSTDKDVSEWFLAEYNRDTNEFQLLLDSNYLQLDETYTENKALYLDPLSDIENKDGHIVFSIGLCSACGGGPNHFAVLNYKTRELKLLGRANLFEWTSPSTYRYKTDREFGISRLDSETKQYIDELHNNCHDHPSICYEQIDWSKIPWQEKTI